MTDHLDDFIEWMDEGTRDPYNIPPKEWTRKDKREIRKRIFDWVYVEPIQDEGESDEHFAWKKLLPYFDNDPPGWLIRKLAETA